MGKLQVQTYDDYAAVSDGKRYELIHGELIEMAPAPNEPHQRTSGNLHYLLKQRIRSGIVGGFVYAAPIDVILDQTNTLQPDLLYITAEREAIITRRGIEGAPDLVIEILSPATRERDLGEKMELYFQHGSREYWIIDPDEQTLSLFVRASESFDLQRTFKDEEQLVSPLLPDFTPRISQLFER